MKKLTFLGILLVISITLVAQPAYIEPVVKVVDGGVPKYIVNEKYYRVPVKHFASDSVFVFRLIDFARNTEIHETVDGRTEKKYKYIMYFIYISKGKSIHISDYDKNLLLSALNNDSHYFYTDGKQLFIAKKEIVKKRWR